MGRPRLITVILGVATITACTGSVGDEASGDPLSSFPPASGRGLAAAGGTPSCVEGALCSTAAETCSAGRCQSCLAEFSPKPVVTKGRVIPVYLVATDTPEADAKKRLATFTHIMASLQQWYSDAMGSAYGFKTFALEEAHLLHSKHTRAEWDAFGVPDCGIYNAAFTELSGGLLASAGLPALGTAQIVYLVVGGGSYRGGCGSPWMAAVEELELDRFAHRCPNGRYDGCDRNCSDPDGLTGIDPWCPEWPHSEDEYGCAPVGGFAHELGHGFGLPHGNTRPKSTGTTIMDEWWSFGRGVTLSAEDKADLDRSEFLAAPPPIPTIKANGHGGSITVSSTPVSITASLAPGSQNGKPADWWIAYSGPAGWYSLTSNGWTPGVNALATHPLSSISPVEILNKQLPVGDYAFYFAVDMNPNGTLESPLYYDEVKVHVSQ